MELVMRVAEKTAMPQKQVSGKEDERWCYRTSGNSYV